jgi:hypothetical protein
VPVARCQRSTAMLCSIASLQQYISLHKLHRLCTTTAASGFKLSTPSWCGGSQSFPSHSPPDLWPDIRACWYSTMPCSQSILTLHPFHHCDWAPGHLFVHQALPALLLLPIWQWTCRRPYQAISLPPMLLSAKASNSSTWGCHSRPSSAHHFTSFRGTQRSPRHWIVWL